MIWNHPFVDETMVYRIGIETAKLWFGKQLASFKSHMMGLMSHCTDRVLYSMLTVDFICFCGYVYNIIYIHCYIYFHPMVSWWSLSYYWWCKRSCASWDWDIWYMIWYGTLVKMKKSPYQPVYDFFHQHFAWPSQDRMPRLAMGHSLGAKLQAEKMRRHTPWETVDVLFLGWFFREIF